MIERPFDIQELSAWPNQRPNKSVSDEEIALNAAVEIRQGYSTDKRTEIILEAIKKSKR